MDYTIKDITRRGEVFEVDVEYKQAGKKQEKRFSFSIESWENEKWKKAIDRRMLHVEKESEIEKDKTRYVGKTFEAKDNLEETPAYMESRPGSKDKIVEDEP